MDHVAGAVLLDGDDDVSALQLPVRRAPHEHLRETTQQHLSEKHEGKRQWASHAGGLIQEDRGCCVPVV